MPRITKGLLESPIPLHPQFVSQLVDELKSTHRVGQPRIEEFHFPKTQAIRVTVLWDQWESLSDEERSATILSAYEQVEGRDFRNRIALAIGLTFPEAYESGMLPYQIIPTIRCGDRVTVDQCQQAMCEVGASVLFHSPIPQLRFASEAEAEEAKKRLIELLPESEPVWTISKEINRLEPYRF